MGVRGAYQEGAYSLDPGLVMPQALPAHNQPTRHAEIAQAIDYLVRNYADQPSLDDVARIAGLSPHLFQRTF